MTLRQIAEKYGLTSDGVDFALAQYQIVISEITHGIMSKLNYYAKDIIQVAQERWCDLKTVSDWISVKDRLPEATKPDAHGNITFSDYVLTYQIYENGHTWVAMNAYRIDNGCWIHDVPGMRCKVTHWMPLPKLPKEVNNE